MADVKMSSLAADASISGTERILSLEDDDTTSKTITPAVIAAYAIDVLAAADDQPTLAAGMDIVGLESDSTEKRFDIDVLSTYVVGSIWSAAGANDPAEAANTFLIDDGGTKKTLTVTVLTTYAMSGAVAASNTLRLDVLDFSGLGALTIASGDLFVLDDINDSNTAKKLTLANLETQLWTDFETYVPTLADTVTVATGDKFYILSAGTTAEWCTGTELVTFIQTQITDGLLGTAFDYVTPTAPIDADLLLTENAGTQKTCTATQLATYVEAEMWAGAGECAAAADVDNLLIDNGGVKEYIGVDNLAAYILDTYFYNHADVETVTALVASDYLLLSRGGDSKKVTWEYLAAGIRTVVLNVSTLNVNSISGSDQILVCESGTNEPTRLTVQALEVQFWADFGEYVELLGDLGAISDADEFYVIDGGDGTFPKRFVATAIPTYVEAAIKTNILDQAFDEAAVDPVADGDLLSLERTNVRKTATVEVMADYVEAEMWAGAGECGAAADADNLLIDDGGTKKYIGVDTLGTYMVAHHLSDAVSADLGAALATDDILIAQADVSKKVTAALMAAYVLDGTTSVSTDFRLDVLDLADATVAAKATPVSTDRFLVDTAGTTQKTTLAQLETVLWGDFATYAVGLGAIVLADADEFYVNDAGAADPKSCTGTVLATYVSAWMWAPAGGAIGDGVLADVDTLLVNDGPGTPKTITAENLADYVEADFAAYAIGLADITTLADADRFYVNDAGADDPKYCTALEIADYVGTQMGVDVWTLISANYSRSSDTVILVDDTSVIAPSDEVGLPVKFTVGGNVCYGITTAVTTNVSVTIAGAAVSGAITLLNVGIRSQVVQVDFEIPHAAWNHSDFVDTDILASHGDKYFKWQRGTGHLVSFSATQHTVDTGVEGKINVLIGGNAVSTNDGSLGIILGAVGVWVDNTATEISTTHYDVAWGESIAVHLTAAGGTGDAGSLTVSCIFVLK